MLSITLAAFAVSVPAALAVGGPPAGTPGASHGQAHRQAHPVAFVLRGVVTATDGTATTITITPSAHIGNHFARVALQGLSTFTVTTDAATKFSKAHMGKATFADVAVNDRVLIKYRALRTATATDLAAMAALRVVDQGPLPSAPTS